MEQGLQVGDEHIERSGVLAQVILDSGEFVNERGDDENEQEDESDE